MKEYAKAVLYAYPLLKTVGADYEEHIKNKAVLSYFTPQGAYKAAEYLAGEILEMRKLEWLKSKVEEALRKLTETERALIAARYFGKRRKAADKPWTERTYFRKQLRLGEKIAGLLTLSGLTEGVYEKEFAQMETFRKIERCLRAGKDKKISARERRWVEDGAK